MHGRKLYPSSVLTPHSFCALLYSISIWRRKWILPPERLRTQGRWLGSWHLGIVGVFPFKPTSFACEVRLQLNELCVYMPSAEVSVITTCGFEFLFRTLKMENQREGKSRKKNKEIWTRKGAEGNNCHWQAKQHDSILFKFVFSLNKVDLFLFQVYPKIWKAAEFTSTSLGYT